MNLNATPETVQSIAEVLKLAAILDDRAPHPDKARIAAWSEQVQRHNLGRTDMLDGLQTFYDSPHQHAISIGDLVAHSRAAKRTRLDKEAETERERRRTELDTKVAGEETRSIVAGMTFGAVPQTPEVDAAERALYCAVDKASAQEAIRGYLTARKVAMRRGPAPKRASA